MALLVANFQLKGKVGNMSFYPTKNGKCIVRGNTRYTPSDFTTNPQYVRTMENASEFAVCAKAAGRIRQAFQGHLLYCSDGSYYNRLVGLLRMVTATDTVSRRGQRSCWGGNMHLLEDFQFNKERSLTSVLKAEYTTQIDPAPVRCGLI